MLALKVDCRKPNPQPDDPQVKKSKIDNVTYSEYSNTSSSELLLLVLAPIVLYSSFRNHRLNRGGHPYQQVHTRREIYGESDFSLTQGIRCDYFTFGGTIYERKIERTVYTCIPVNY